MSAGKAQLLIDTDAGVDDARAIITAFGHADVLALTTVRGNTGVRQAAANCSRLRRLCGKEEVPIYLGCAGPIVPRSAHPHRCQSQCRSGCEQEEASVHGGDGLGCRPHAPPELTDADFEAHDTSMGAAQAIVHYADKLRGELVLVCIGPLTNVALALKTDPLLGGKLKRVHIMGGNIFGIGNVRRTSSEFNFHADPEAACIVLAELRRCPVYVVPWDVCTIGRTPLPVSRDFDYESHLHLGTARSRFLRACSGRIRDFCAASADGQVTFVDDVALCSAIDASVVKASVAARPWVELAGGRTRGQLSFDWQSADNDGGNVHFVTEYDVRLVDAMIRAALAD